MKTYSVRVKADPLNDGVELDGRPLNSVTRVEIDYAVNALPEVTLHLAVFEGALFESEAAVVVIPASTAESLIALGWTPPCSCGKPFPEDGGAEGVCEIRVVAERGEPFSANDVRPLLPPGLRPALVGARFLAASKRRQIVKVGWVPSTDPGTHAHPVALWVTAEAVAA